MISGKACETDRLDLINPGLSCVTMVMECKLVAVDCIYWVHGTMLVLVCTCTEKRQGKARQNHQNDNNKTCAQSKWGSNAVFGAENHAVRDKRQLVTKSALWAFAFLVLVST